MRDVALKLLSGTITIMWLTTEPGAATWLNTLSYSYCRVVNSKICSIPWIFYKMDQTLLTGHKVTRLTLMIQVIQRGFNAGA